MSVGNKKPLFPWRNSDFQKQTVSGCCYYIGGARRIWTDVLEGL